MTEIFDEFFDSGKEESVSPFLTKESRKWGKNLHLKSAILAAFFLGLSFLTPVHGLSLLFAYFFAGIPALIASIEDLFDFEINIDVLMTLAAFLSVLIGSGQEGALLLVLFSFSTALEEAVRTKARGKLSSMKKLAPTKALVVTTEGKMVERSVRDIAPGSVIHVRAGDIVALDGIVLRGTSSVNLVHLTGENLPVRKIVGDEVQAGSRNLEGAITLKVLRGSSESALAKIALLIEEAEKAKPQLERWFDRFSSAYAMTIIGLAVIFALTFPFLLKIPFLGTEGSIYRSLAFLIAASPCALIIALPIAYLSAISASASKGILLKGGVVLDALASCKKIAIDKTGTLTTGVLDCVAIEGEGSIDSAISMAAALEQSANHPIAFAILRLNAEKKLSIPQLNHFKLHPGYGLEGKFGDLLLFIGNVDFILPKLTEEKKQAVFEKIKEIEKHGEVMALFLMGDSLFFFRFKDRLRPEAELAVRELKTKCKMSVVVLSGDHYSSVSTISKEAGIEEFYSDLRPDEKLKKIAELAKKENLAMVGDGINDAPALAMASVGISMGQGGSQTAIDASDIVLLRDAIDLLPWLVKKARATTKIVKQNLAFALAAILIATTPALLGWIPLWVAVLLHEGGTVAVGLNALRLLKDERKAPEGTAKRKQKV